MNVPSVDINGVSVGINDLQKAMAFALSKLGEATVVFFLDQVPERGQELLDRFRNYQSEKGGNVGFLEFMQEVVTADPMKMLFPRECLLNVMERRMLMGEIRREIKRFDVIKNDRDVLQIYFGQGSVYNSVRKIICRGCEQTKCRHNLGLRS